MANNFHAAGDFLGCVDLKTRFFQYDHCLVNWPVPSLLGHYICRNIFPTTLLSGITYSIVLALCFASR
jgi:hypothetical protein